MFQIFLFGCQVAPIPATITIFVVSKNVSENNLQPLHKKQTFP